MEKEFVDIFRERNPEPAQPARRILAALKGGATALCHAVRGRSPAAVKAHLEQGARVLANQLFWRNEKRKESRHLRGAQGLSWTRRMPAALGLRHMAEGGTGRAVSRVMRLLCPVLAAVACCGFSGCGEQAGSASVHPALAANSAAGPVTLVYETQSAFSHIRVKDYGKIRALHFVNASGEESLQTMMEKDAPQRLVSSYPKAMFSSFALRYPQEKVLILGLGGGAMVRFLQECCPETRIDVVEIDPAVVDVASRFFGARQNDRTEIVTEDAFVFLRRTREQYDAIYMDTFLEPSSGTDARGVPRRLKTVAFLKSLHKNLHRPAGMLVINLLRHTRTEEDLQSIREAFPTHYFIDVPRSGNIIAIGVVDAPRVTKGELVSRARKLDEQFPLGFSTEGFVRAMRSQ